MNDHISKPIDPDMLFDALARWRGYTSTNASTSANTSASTTSQANPPHAPTLSVVEANRRTPAIDVASALRRVGGNLSLYHKLLGRFASKSTTTVQEIQLALLSGASQEAERMAHTVRGVAGNLGAMPLADAACDLELAINANAEKVGEALHAFEQCMQDFVQEAQALLDEQGVG
jgi:two-component system sensor histidine kinase/response regulator